MWVCTGRCCRTHRRCSRWSLRRLCPVCAFLSLSLSLSLSVSLSVCVCERERESVCVCVSECVCVVMVTIFLSVSELPASGLCVCACVCLCVRIDGQCLMSSTPPQTYVFVSPYLYQNTLSLSSLSLVRVYADEKRMAVHSTRWSLEW